MYFKCEVFRKLFNSYSKSLSVIFQYNKFSKCSGWWHDDHFQYLQKSIIPTMHFQKSLPRLPIPELEKTCERYLRSLKPIFPKEVLQDTQKIVEEFLKGDGPVLQDTLKRNDKKNKLTSYISGPWTEMYLTSRASLVLNYNPFMSFKNDAEKEYNTQVLRASNMLLSTLRFMKSLKENILEPEVFHLNPTKSDTAVFRKIMRLLPETFSWHGAYLFKAFPLDMTQFNNLFCSTRIPYLDRDNIQVFPEARHIVVLKNGWFYVFDVFDRDGNILPPSHIYSCLLYISSECRAPPAHPVSVLTTENRNTWTKAREHLVQLGNIHQLYLIDSAIFALVLDNDILGDNLVKAAHNMLHGPSFNRWFDKSFQLILSRDGNAAVNFEHSWGDGVAVLRYFNDIYQDSSKNHFVGPDTLPASVDASLLVQKLNFNLDEQMKSVILKAVENYKCMTGALNLDVLRYQNMNRDTIKNHKLSPDSIAQLGFQMAFYKVHSKFVSAYESCSTAAFKHGRTETVRPVTDATRDCVEAFHSYIKPSVIELKNKLHLCTKVHNQLTKEAAMGEGFDRHLFGLKYIAEHSGRNLPHLYHDPVYKEANHFTLSTSTLYGPAFSGGGFGPVVKDGFGIAYGFLDNSLGCLISSYSCRDGPSFVDALYDSYENIYQVLNSTEF